MSQRVLIVGTGLIGGSAGLALRRTGGYHVTGCDTSADTLNRALHAGVVDEAVQDPSAAAATADIIIVATPVGQILPTVRVVATAAPDSAVVTDVGSAKAAIVEHAEAILGPARSFVGGHPMAGSEREGVDAARHDLFEGALWLLTPTPRTEPEAYRRVHALVTCMGAKTLAVDPTTHDRLVALVSHLPYLLGSVLMDVAASRSDPRIFQAAAGSFRDMTRTAGTAPRVWRDILHANREAVISELEMYIAGLSAVRDALDASDWQAVENLIERARGGRRELPLKGEIVVSELVELEVPVPDRAGVLARITTALGDAGVNIEDLRLEHSGGQAGTVHIVVQGREAADRAVGTLVQQGYRPAIVET